MRVMCVAGARPNFMKIKPVMDGLENLGAETLLVHTGQHYDANMSEVFFDELGIRAPDRHLGIGSGTYASQVGGVRKALEPVIAAEKPDIVVVVGDVNSTVGAALAADRSPALLAHVESGLRSDDWTMPEEINRVITDRVSEILFAPSRDAVENLIREGRPADAIHFVGNVMVDSLLANLDRARERSILNDLSLEPRGYALVTLHRPSNVDDDGVLVEIVETLETLASRLPVIFPVHPRVAARVPRKRSRGLRVIDALGYLDFIALEAGALVVLTDSGGIQEETTILGVPCLTLRDNTERPITIEAGTNRLIGRGPGGILQGVEDVLTNERETPEPPELWDGRAGERIADVLMGPRRVD